MLPKLKTRTENSIHFVIEGNAFMEGYLFLTPEPLKLFPYEKDNLTLQILDEEGTNYTAILHKNYRYIACLGFKHWYQKNRVMEGDEVILTAINYEQKKFTIELIRKASISEADAELKAAGERKTRIVIKPSATSVLEYSHQSVGILKKILNDRFDSQEKYHINAESVQISALQPFDNPLGLNSMMGTLIFPHQQRQTHKIIKEMSGRALLCDEAGLGKSVEAIQVIMEYYTRNLARKILILTPASSAFRWQEDLWVKAGLESVNHFEIQDWSRHDVIVSSMDTAKSTKNREDLQKIDFDIVVIDEAHRLKNPSTKNWKFVNTLSTKFMIFLTASPIHNDLTDLYNLVTILKPGLLKSPAWFKETFMGNVGKRTQLKNKEQFKDLISQIIIRTTREETDIPFPKPHGTQEPVLMTPTESETYKSLRNLVWEKIESVPEVVKGSILNREVFLSLLETAGISLHTLKFRIEDLLKGPIREDLHLGLDLVRKKLSNLKEDSRLEKLIKILANLKEKAVVFFGDTQTLESVSEALGKRRFHTFSVKDEMSSKEKDQIIQTFSRIHQGFLLLDNTAGNGRHFGEPRVMINYDIPWSPVVMEQRIGRVFTLRNQQKIEIINLMWEGSIEHILVENAYIPIKLFNIIPGELETLMMCIKGRKSLEQILLDGIAFAENEISFNKTFEDLNDYLGKIYKEFQGVVALQNQILS